MSTKKSSPKKSSATKDEGKPMDDTLRERAVGVASTNNQRPCYAIKQLVKEVDNLFPETTHEVNAYNGLNVGLDVTFDLTALDNDSAIDLTSVLGLLGGDIRVADVIAETDGGAVLVSIKPSARTQDVRDSFGLADALSVLAGDEGYDTDEDDLLSEGTSTWDGGSL